MLLPVVLKFTFDPLLKDKDIFVLGRKFKSEDLLLFVVFLGILVAIVRGVSNYFFLALSSRCGHSLVADLRNVMFEHVLRIPVSYVDKRGTGKILLRFIGDSDALRNWFSRSLPNSRADVLLMVVLASGMFWLDWQLACSILVSIPILLLIVLRLSSRLNRLTLQARILQARFTGQVQSRFGDIRQSKWLDSEHGLRRDIDFRAHEISRNNAERDRCAAMLKSACIFFTFLSIPIIIGFGISLVRNASISTGEFFAFIWFAAHFSVAIRRLSGAIVVREKAKVSISRILRLLQRSAERRRGSSTLKIKPECSSIRCEELVFCDEGLGSHSQPLNHEWQGAGTHKLDSRIDVRQFSEFLMGFRRGIRGDVFLDGKALSQLNTISLRRCVGWITKSPLILDLTVEENIQIAKPEVTRSELLELHRIEKLQMSEKSFASWLERSAGPNGCHLSYQDRLTISAMRVLIRKPGILLVESPQWEVVKDILGAADLSCAMFLIGTNSSVDQVQSEMTEFIHC